MWREKNLLNVIQKFLPPTSQIVLLKKPYERAALELIDLDGDEVSELVCAYYWQGEYYIIILKYQDNDWNLLDTVKGKGYNITYFDSAPITSKDKNNLIVGWQVGAIWSDLSVYELTNTKIKDLISGNKYFSKIEVSDIESTQGIDFSAIDYIHSETKRDIHLEEALTKEFNLDQGLDNIRYYYNKVDLNDDGIPEIFAFLIGSFVCGTGGCSAVIFKYENGEYKLLSRFSLVRNPVIISNKKTNGYSDIIMNVSGGGIESFFAELKYDGTTYPSNPSIQPKIKSGIKVEGVAIIADDISKNLGIEIKN